MLWTIAVILVVVWLVALLTGRLFGGILHALLVIAVVVILVRLLTG